MAYLMVRHGVVLRRLLGRYGGVDLGGVNLVCLSGILLKHTLQKGGVRLS